jgi:hypothetical protein
LPDTEEVRTALSSDLQIEAAAKLPKKRSSTISASYYYKPKRDEVKRAESDAEGAWTAKPVGSADREAGTVTEKRPGVPDLSADGKTPNRQSL